MCVVLSPLALCWSVLCVCVCLSWTERYLHEKNPPVLDCIKEVFALCVLDCVFVCVCGPAYTLSITRPEALILFLWYLILCHYLLFPKKQKELRELRGGIASCKAAGKDLCHSVPCRGLFMYLSASPSRYLLSCRLAFVQRDELEFRNLANSHPLLQKSWCAKPPNPLRKPICCVLRYSDFHVFLCCCGEWKIKHQFTGDEAQRFVLINTLIG